MPGDLFERLQKAALELSDAAVEEEFGVRFAKWHETFVKITTLLKREPEYINVDLYVNNSEVRVSTIYLPAQTILADIPLKDFTLDWLLGRIREEVDGILMRFIDDVRRYSSSLHNRATRRLDELVRDALKDVQGA